MDEMQPYEIQPLVSNIYKKNKESWEQTRFISYIVAQTQSTKRLKINDILSFSWDEKDEVNLDTSISNEEVERLRKKANQLINKK